MTSSGPSGKKKWGPDGIHPPPKQPFSLARYTRTRVAAVQQGLGLGSSPVAWVAPGRVLGRVLSKICYSATYPPRGVMKSRPATEATIPSHVHAAESRPLAWSLGAGSQSGQGGSIWVRKCRRRVENTQKYDAVVHRYGNAPTCRDGTYNSQSTDWRRDKPAFVTLRIPRAGVGRACWRLICAVAIRWSIALASVPGRAVLTSCIDLVAGHHTRTNAMSVEVPGAGFNQCPRVSCTSTQQIWTWTRGQQPGALAYATSPECRQLRRQQQQQQRRSSRQDMGCDTTISTPEQAAADLMRSHTKMHHTQSCQIRPRLRSVQPGNWRAHSRRRRWEAHATRLNYRIRHHAAPAFRPGAWPPDATSLGTTGEEPSAITRG